jgi:hypothetical protein
VYPILAVEAGDHGIVSCAGLVLLATGVVTMGSELDRSRLFLGEVGTLLGWLASLLFGVNDVLFNIEARVCIAMALCMASGGARSWMNIFFRCTTEARSSW